MKRGPRLIPLSKERHESLVLARKCRRTAAVDNHDDIAQLCQQITVTFPDKWESHFRREETGVFTPAETHAGEMATQSHQLRQEYDRLRELYRAMKDGDCSGPNTFGEFL